MLVMVLSLFGCWWLLIAAVVADLCATPLVVLLGVVPPATAEVPLNRLSEKAGGRERRND